MLRVWLSFVVIALLAFAVPAGSEAQTVRSIANRGACSTAGVEGLSAQLAEAQTCLFPGAFVSFAPHSRISLSSSRVHPYAQATTRDALHRAGVNLTINSAFRSVADQYVLYHSGGCAAAARPGRSNHQSGRAVDVQNYSAVRSALEAQGCRWLGAGDPVHFDCPGADLRADTVKAFQRLWNVNNPSDQITEDGLYGPTTADRLGRSPAGGFPSDACDTVPPPTGTSGRLLGVVYEGADISDRVAGATVRLGGETVTTGSDGSWSFEVDAGTFTVEVTAAGFADSSRTCLVESGDVWCSVSVTTESAGSNPLFIEGRLTSQSGAAITNGQVVVTATGQVLATGADGTWRTEIPAGTYSLAASAPGYVPASTSCMAEESPGGCDLVLSEEAAELYVLQGVVFVNDDANRRAPGVRVNVLETGASVTARGGDAFWSFNVPSGTYTIEATGTGVTPTTRVCQVSSVDTWCSISVAEDARGGGSFEEVEPDDERVEPDAADLDSARRASATGCQCSAETTSGESALFGLLLFGLVALRRPKS